MTDRADAVAARLPGRGGRWGRRRRRRRAGDVRRLRRACGGRRGRAGRRRTAGTYPFTGVHQAGIVTPAQDRMYTAAFDLTTTSRDELVALLRRGRRWPRGSAPGCRRGRSGRRQRAVRRAARRHRRGRTCPPAGPDPHDRVRAVAVHRTPGRGRRRPVRHRGTGCPTALVALPHFPGDDLDPARSDGDLVRPGVRRRPAGRDARDPQPDPGGVRDGARSAGRSSASGGRRPRRARR